MARSGLPSPLQKSKPFQLIDSLAGGVVGLKLPVARCRRGREVEGAARGRRDRMDRRLVAAVAYPD